MHVHLLLPDLLLPDLLSQKAAASSLPGALSLPDLPALEMMIARARRSPMPSSSGAESWLAAHYELPDTSATAPFSLLGDGGDPGQARWLRADPVYLRADRDALVLADATQFPISADEATALCDGLNSHFAPALQFDPVTPERWYARMDAASGLRWTPLALARGKPLAAYLPQGNAAMRWNALVNELQMLLHAHPVNAERESRGDLPINSVWLWGEGGSTTPTEARASASGKATRPWGRVFANDPVARGLAMASGGSAAPLPPDAASLLTHAPDSGRVLIVLDGLRTAAAYGDALQWAESLSQLERDWFAPLMAALTAGRIGMITLSCPGTTGPEGQATRGLEAELIRTDLRRFWRRRKPVSQYVSPESET